MADSGSGILRLTKKRAGHLYDPAEMRERIFVPAGLVRDFKLSDGATVSGPVQRSQKGLQLKTVEAVCYDAGAVPRAYTFQEPHRH